MKQAFRQFAAGASDASGSPWMFLMAVAVIVVWGISGPLFHFSDTWQLVINTGTTIITFLMVFLVQNTQNRDAKAIHLKLDELILATRNARTGMVNLETLSDEELAELQHQFARLQSQHPSVEAFASEVRDEVESTVHEELERHAVREAPAR